MSENRFQLFCAVHLVLIQNNQVLLLKRKNTGYQDGNYGLVTGHMEKGETAKQAIIREAQEEAGIKVWENSLKETNFVHWHWSDRDYFHIFLTTNSYQGEMKNQEPTLCEHLKWFNLTNLPENIVPETKLALNNMAKGDFYGEIGWDQ